MNEVNNNFTETVTITLKHYERLQQLLKEAKQELERRKETIEERDKVISVLDSIFQQVGLNVFSDHLIDSDSLSVAIDQNPMTLQKRVVISFNVNE